VIGPTGIGVVGAGAGAGAGASVAKNLKATVATVVATGAIVYESVID
jgi:hypothetical protein